MNKIILVYCPCENGEFASVCRELAAEAQRLLPGPGWEIQGVCFAREVGAISGRLADFPFTEMVCFETPNPYEGNAKAASLALLCQEKQPAVFLLGATAEGRALAPVVAARLQAGLTADCTGLALDATGSLVQTRPAFEETLLASIKTRGFPQIATVRPGLFAPLETPCTVQTRLMRRYAAEPHAAFRLIGTEPAPSSGIADARILVAAGGGVQKKDLDTLERYARRLGGQFACSRKLVERGWMPQTRQIGLSGTAVKADLLVTVGISGSTQFLAGIPRVKKLVAVNRDVQAPIFAVAAKALVLDVDEFILALNEEEENETNS